MRRSVSAVANRHGDRPTPDTRSGIATGLEPTGTRPPRSRIAMSRGLDAGFGNPNLAGRLQTRCLPATFHESASCRNLYLRRPDAGGHFLYPWLLLLSA